MSSSFFDKVVKRFLLGAPPKRFLERLTVRNSLYSRLGLAVIVIVAFACGAASRVAAQQRPELKRPMEEPEEKPAEPKKKKKQKDPRAVGLLRFDSKGKATLIPVAVLVDGRFYDATSYKADPVPMALESGTVYEAEQAGESQGLFTVNGALHSKTAGSVSPWMGTGSFLPRGTEAAKTTHKAEDVPVGMDSTGDEPPRLTKGKGSQAEAAPSNSTPTADAGNSPSGTSSGTPSPSAPSSGTTSGASGGSSNKSGETPPATAKPSDSPGAASSKEDPAKTAPSRDADAETQPSSEQTQNYYRPTLRRGKPTESAPQEVETAPSAGKIESPSGTTSAPQEPVKLVPAISDAGGPEPKPYKFFWKQGEEDERRNQLLALAADELRIYVNARAKGMISAKPPAAKAGAAARKIAAKPAQPVFENTQFHAFDAWVNNQPVMILTAEAHYPPLPGASAAPEVYDITLAARTDIYGSLRKMYSGVTDKFHLDVTPRLELIDAVDADGDGRAELVFRKTTDTGSGYVIYRPTADKLWKMFDSME